MTREEIRLRRRQNRLWGLCWFIVLVWIARLLLTLDASAAVSAAEEGAAEPDRLTTVLAVIGAWWSARAILRGIEMLDDSRRERK